MTKVSSPPLPVQLKLAGTAALSISIARFIVAFPSEGTAGSDITANAFEGEGGSINIESEGLFGIEFREDLEPPPERALAMTSRLLPLLETPAT